MLISRSAALAVLFLSSNAVSQEIGTDDASYIDGVLVTSADVSSCPYRLVQPITASVTEDYGADSREKIFGKLRAKAKRLSADAVVLVQRGDTHMTAFAWNRREYTGRAIRYVDRGCAPTR
jgi:uncharacterized protein YbjQ (UPF0145 family)